MDSGNEDIFLWIMKIRFIDLIMASHGGDRAFENSIEQFYG